jgi:hypothetical protein
MNENILDSLDDIAASLKLIAIALKEANEIKNNGYNITFGGNKLTDCVSKEEIPLPTPWNSDNTPSCKSDILYKEPETPNWYNIKEDKK